MKRKVIAALLAATMTVSLLTGCVGNDSQQSNTGSTNSVVDSTGEASSDDNGSQSTEGLKTLRILGVDHAGTDGNGQTVKLSDWVNGDSKLWERFTSDFVYRRWIVSRKSI